MGSTKTRKPQFTPAPWRLVRGNPNAIQDATGELVCILPENSSNARLIVLAPDLYAALSLACETWDSRSTKKRSAAWLAMTAALANVKE